jgi:hypothetical protein
LFKIEYDLQIKKLGIPAPVANSPNFSTKKKVSQHAKIVYTFADDCNILCNRDSTSLTKLKVNLTSFEKLSGLDCNVEKTNILCIGPGSNNDDDILEHGFAVKENLKVLGMKISNNFTEDLLSS